MRCFMLIYYIFNLSYRIFMPNQSIILRIIFLFVFYLNKEVSEIKSQTTIDLSNPALYNLVPSLLNLRQVIALLCPSREALTEFSSFKSQITISPSSYLRSRK